MKQNYSLYITKLLAIFQIVFVICYFVYFLYIGLQWGFGERMKLLLFSDSVYIFLFVSTIGLLTFRRWGWWLSIILYAKLLLARAVTVIATFVNIRFGFIAETLHIYLFLSDLLLILLFAVIIVFFTRPATKKLYGISLSGVRLFFLAGTSAVIVYFIYFIVMLLMVNSFL
ncbi:hypothetical protein SAMN05421736_104142 [Evansella caseinilytica]|uniref:Uncharacterized protein n=1 Tax=Evansella caseinilytica TaxID=1503961 RepID=A0A1H3NNB3_9BACI|nr:hypothetical protein [Evansella caseinilytica]SDY90401.1 hypothetical protein SAMN05421736_104142 [Evansella caseinilytica]